MTSIWKKVIMGLTGLFLISFLVVHCGINSLIFLNDGGKAFGEAGHFMGTNPVIRIMEIGLVIGFLVHIIDGLLLWSQNNKARPKKYAAKGASANSKWYSRSMGLLGTLLLLFLIMHTAHFWIPNRGSQFMTGHEIDLFAKMKVIFSEWWIVVIYVVGCISLFWHLLHGFKSAFQSLGINHSKYNPIISMAGTAFAIICPLIFALMPIVMYLGIIK
jgi:succinate dehydrogenase / fumarate reductase, cytochrome b subunit